MTNLILNLPFLGPIARDCMAILFLCLMFVLKQFAHLADAEGAAKKEQAVREIDEVIEKEGGIDWPKYLDQRMQDLVISTFIELWVFLAKKLGGALPSSTGSKPAA